MDVFHRFRYRNAREYVRRFGIIFLLLPCLLSTVPPSRAAESSGQYNEALAVLAGILREKGVDIEPLFADSLFVIHDDIRTFFEGAVEKTEMDSSLASRDRGDQETAERQFDEGYARYRKMVSFDKKCEEIGPFMAEHAEKLDACEEEYGIPKDILAAVIGIETHFGAVIGRHRAFNVYVSMYVTGYRQKFALTQLTELLRFAESRGVNIFTLKSSYAGAIGSMQFIPASLNRWFVGDDVYDMDDAIASVANYLAYFKASRGSLEKALYAYNNSRLYVTAVTDLAAYTRSAP